jgi:hypothetical protein
MNEMDKPAFGRALNSAMEVTKYGRPVGPDAFDLWCATFQRFTLDQVLEALSKHTVISTDAPTPADVLEILRDGLGHMDAEEAWNRIPKFESDAGYISNEMSEAYGACADSVERGDMIGARVCFIEVYKKLITRAKLEGREAVYYYSSPTGIGYEQAQELKRQKTEEACVKGWLNKDSAYVKHILQITDDSNKISLEDLTKKANEKSEAKEKALDNIRQILG